MSKKPRTKALDFATKVMLAEAKAIEEEAFGDIFNHQNIAKLPESVFRQDFLPYFSGQIIDDRTRQITTVWIGIAGSPTSPVDVVDQEGKTLFQVPPVMSTTFLERAQNSNIKSFGELFDMAQRQDAYLPGTGQNLLASAVTLRTDKSKLKPEEESVKGWDAIFKYYNLNTTKKASSSGAAEEGPNYDELIFD